MAPLTKETASFHNGGGGNWGAEKGAGTNVPILFPSVLEAPPTQDAAASSGDGTPTELNFWSTVQASAMLHVPGTVATLKDAMKQVHGDDRLTTIVLGKGTHLIDGSYLRISSAMNIAGDPEVPTSEIVVMSGIYFKKKIPGICHLQHLTLRQAKGCGVWGQSSFTMEDVLVDQVGGSGVVAEGPGVVGRCTDVEVRACGMSGVSATMGASIALIGGRTKIIQNCTTGSSKHFGLQVSGSLSSTVHLVFPLRKENVATQNGGGGNW